MIKKIHKNQLGVNRREGKKQVAKYVLKQRTPKFFNALKYLFFLIFENSDIKKYTIINIF